MWTRTSLKLLFCVLAAVKVHCYWEDELCPRKEPSPGVLVLKLGSNVVIGCRDDVAVDDVPLVSASFTPQRDTVYVDVNDQTNVKGTATIVTSQMVIDSGKYTKAKEDMMVTVKPFLTQREDQPTSRRFARTVDQPAQSEKVGGARQEEEAYVVTNGTDLFSEQDEYDDNAYEEEGSRVTKGIKKRTRWTLNGRQVRVGVERGGILRLPHFSLASAGNYSCYRGERLMSTININVGGNVTRIPCSFSRSRCWCAFPVEEGDWTLHMARLCVTNTAGNTTSPEINFQLHDIVKPDPPTKVEVRAVEGQQHMLKVSWSYPISWKHGLYILHFELRYRLQQAEKYHSVWIDERLDRRLYWTIDDALPHTQYEIQLRARDEFGGIWSDWTDTVFAFTWSSNVIHIAPENKTTSEKQ